MDRMAYTQTDGHNATHKDGQNETLTDRQNDVQTNKKNDTQTNGQNDIQTMNKIINRDSGRQTAQMERMTLGTMDERVMLDRQTNIMINAKGKKDRLTDIITDRQTDKKVRKWRCLVGCRQCIYIRLYLLSENYYTRSANCINILFCMAISEIYKIHILCQQYILI